MKNKFNRIIAGLMATASLATGMIGMGSNAADVTTPVEPEIVDEYNGPSTVRRFDDNIDNHATAEGDAGSNYAWFSTSDSYASHTSINITAVTGTIYDDYYWYSDGTYISHSYSGSNITKVTCRHTATETIGVGITDITRYVAG